MTKIVIDGREYETFVSKSLDYCKAGQTAILLVTDYKTNHFPQESPLAYCQRIGLTEFIDYTFIFDYLIMNIDRYGRNIELLYDGNSVVSAPIFDNGRCLTAECGNQIQNILKWNYRESGMGINILKEGIEYKYQMLLNKGVIR